MSSILFLTAPDLLTPILIVIAVLAIGLFIGLAIRESRRQIRQNQTSAPSAKTEEATAADDDWIPPEPEAYPARVVDMRVLLGNVGGHKRPKTGTSFLVTFLTDEGNRVEYPVPEELYVTLSIDQTGTLVILNEGFFYFGDGEDIEETE